MPSAGSLSDKGASPSGYPTVRAVRGIHGIGKCIYRQDAVSFHGTFPCGIFLQVGGSVLYHELEYTFYFVGNVDVETLKPLVEQYIASIPGKAVPAAKNRYATSLRWRLSSIPHLHPLVQS